jgi:DNA-binding NtrC family response regulator
MDAKEQIRVLLVDDEERFRVTTSATLKRRGFHVTGAATGFEAVEEVKKTEFDIVVLDVKMPGMDGTEALHIIKTYRPALPVILLTGHGIPVWEHKTYMDCVRYLVKPCDMETLIRMIVRMVAERKEKSEKNAK